MRVRLTHIDGKLPNLALMNLAHHHRERGDEVTFSRSLYRDMLEPDYGRVYGSAIFSYSAPKVAIFRQEFPRAVVGGTWNTKDKTTVDDVLGAPWYGYDYSIYPGFDASIGFTQRGCRFKCGFCCVPGKEGKPRTVSSVPGIWRGDPYPRHIHLLDNDFFGQPQESWEAHIAAIKSGGFKVCLNQGINIRMIDDVSAARMASIPYYDDSFKVRRLYTAWDNIGDEERFFKGVATLERHGVPSSHIMAYMLVGYDKRETWARIFHRFERMVALGIRPYPMVFNAERSKMLPLGDCLKSIAHRTLGEFQRWAIRKAYTFIPFEHYDVNAKGRANRAQLDMLSASEGCKVEAGRVGK